MTRLKAFASHIGISLFIFLVILYLIVFKWYPPPFFSSDGGWQGVRIMIGVDMVLGPLLTLIIYRPGKRGLKFDLTMIGLIQTGALIWGIWTIHQQRPFAAVYVNNYFATVTRLETQSQNISPARLNALGKNSPYWIYSDLPKDPNAFREIQLESLRMGRPLYTYTKYYSPISPRAMQEMTQRSLDMSAWLKDKPAAMQQYKDFVQSQKNPNNLIYIPWHARDKYEIIAMNTLTRRFAGKLEIAPPQPKDKFPSLNPSGKQRK